MNLKQASLKLTSAKQQRAPLLLFQAVLWIQIRMFLSLLDPDPDPDPLVRGMDPAPDTDPSFVEQK
jgi:hypothetical protein